MGFGTLNVELSRFIANSDSEFVDKVDHVGAPAIGDDGHAERGGAVCDGSQDSGGGGGNYRDVVRMEVGDVEVASVGVIATPIGMELTPPVDPVAAPLLGAHTKEVLREILHYDDRRITALAGAGAFGKTKNAG